MPTVIVEAIVGMEPNIENYVCIPSVTNDAGNLARVHNILDCSLES